MSHSISFTNVEVSSLKIATAKNGNLYASGFIVDRNERGLYTTSKKFRTFEIAEQVKAIPALAEFAALSPEAQKAAKEGGRPVVNISGWLKNSADEKGIWREELVLTSITA